MVVRTDRGIVKLDSKNGGVSGFTRDLLNFSQKFEKLTKSQLLKIMRVSARAYVTKYNRTMGKEGAKRMATAKLGSNYMTGKDTLVVKVTTSLLSKYYDVAKPHPVWINNKPTLRKWVQRKWKFDDKLGWKSSKRRAMQSYIYGPRKRPFGYLQVTSYETRHGISVHDLSMQRARNTLSEELRRFNTDAGGKRWSRDTFGKTMKPMYETKIFVNV